MRMHACVFFLRALLIVGWLFLYGCGGGGDSVDVARGQGLDPVVLDVAIAYVKRPLPVDAQGNVIPSDARELITFDIGADLFVRDLASPSATERNITENETQGLGDIRDLETAYDGSKVLFAMRAQFIPGADEEDQPTWNIWEYDILADTLTRIIASDMRASPGTSVRTNPVRAALSVAWRTPPRNSEVVYGSRSLRRRVQRSTHVDRHHLVAVGIVAGDVGHRTTLLVRGCLGLPRERFQYRVTPTRFRRAPGEITGPRLFHRTYTVFTFEHDVQFEATSRTGTRVVSGVRGT